MNRLLRVFLNKSFSKLAPNCTISNGEIAEVIKTAAMTQDFLEGTTKKRGNKPNADIIFQRIEKSDIDKLKTAFIFILEFIIKHVKQKFNRREWILAIDTHYEPFYGNYKSIWIHGYKPKDCKDCKGSYCYITIAIVIGDVKFTLLALPVHLGQNMAGLIEELVTLAKKHLKVGVVLLDRGFYSGNVIRELKRNDVKYIIFARKTDKTKRFLEQTPSFGHKYFYDYIEWNEDKSTQREQAKYLVIKDYIDLRTFKIFDWIFLTNLSKTKAITYVHLYMTRWCIENTYKQFNAFKIKTTSNNFLVRFFFFLFRILLYNLWKFYNIITDAKTTFKGFVFTLFLSTLDIDYVTRCKNEFKKIEKMICIKT